MNSHIHDPTIDRQREVTQRLIKLMLIALHNEFGFGADRLLRAYDALYEITNTAIDRYDDCYEEAVDRELERIGLRIRRY